MSWTPIAIPCSGRTRVPAGAKGLRGAVLPHRASRPRGLQAGIVCAGVGGDRDHGGDPGELPAGRASCGRGQRAGATHYSDAARLWVSFVADVTRFLMIRPPLRPAGGCALSHTLPGVARCPTMRRLPIRQPRGRHLLCGVCDRFHPLCPLWTRYPAAGGVLHGLRAVSRRPGSSRICGSPGPGSHAVSNRRDAFCPARVRCRAEAGHGPVLHRGQHGGRWNAL